MANGEWRMANGGWEQDKEGLEKLFSPVVFSIRHPPSAIRHRDAVHFGPSQALISRCFCMPAPYF
jgi:hypothetical protein